MAKQIYYVMSCDEWKGTDSMNVIFIGTSTQKLKMFVSDEIEKENMLYKEWEDLTPKQQAKKFRSDWGKALRTDINSDLTYGYIGYCYNNDPDSI